jgi:hypothetical protein
LKLRGFLILTIVLVGLLSCNRNQPASTTSLAYFDNPGFFQKEIIRLNASKVKLLKTVMTNGKSEQRRIDTPDWKKEINVFESITLNKSSFAGKYAVDSASINGICITSYSTLDAKLPVSHFAFADSAGSIRWIEAVKLEHSPLIDNDLQWRYVPDSGYAVSGKQKLSGLSPSVFRVSAIFGN